MFVTLSTLRILIVDDQALIRTAMRHILTGLGAKHVDEAVSGEQAIERLLTTNYELVISDIDMSPVNGLQLLKHIRTGDYGLKRDTLFVMLTGVATKEFVTSCIALDVNAFLTKPPKKELMMARLQYALTTPFKLKEASQYEQMELPELLAKAPVESSSAAITTQTPISANAATKPKPAADIASDLEQQKEDDDVAQEPGMFYIIWSDKFSAGIPSVDALLKKNALLMNKAYAGRGEVFADGSQDQFLQECFVFASEQLREIEQILAYSGHDIVRRFAEARVALSASLARSRLVMQVSPELVNYEIFNAMKNWWHRVISLINENRDKLSNQ